MLYLVREEQLGHLRHLLVLTSVLALLTLLDPPGPSADSEITWETHAMLSSIYMFKLPKRSNTSQALRCTLVLSMNLRGLFWLASLGHRSPSQMFIGRSIEERERERERSKHLNSLNISLTYLAPMMIDVT